MLRFVVVALVCLLLVTACDPGIGIRIENHTGASIVFCESNRGEPNLSDEGSCVSQSSGKTTTWSVLCESDWMKWVVICIGENKIYSASATCGTWKKTGAWIKVEFVDGRFVASDSLSNKR